ncbi:tetratricopeptide repeat protein [Propionivibrio limicola]|uniref:tetratricopeptide repeat protein n=1 Tax=Propionivibrio limicola TaxID=167645 RepID=UPI001478AE70|nr:tetratricopeptide repeat protein [Propionivibrio limicola]
MPVPPRLRLTLSLALMLLCLGSRAAHSQSWRDWIEQTHRLPPAAALERLENAPESFRQLADYYYWRGHYTKQTGGSTEAANELFEHALMLDPDHAGAWYDLGIGLCKAGDLDSCKTLLLSAKERFGAPPIAPESLPAFIASGEIRTRLGYSNNLNAGSQTAALGLWLDGQRILLPLANASRAQASGFIDTTIDLQAIPTFAPRWSLALTAYGRHPFQHRDILGNYHLFAFESGYAVTAQQRTGVQTYRMEDSQQGSLAAHNLWWQYIHTASATQSRITAERRIPDGTAPSYTSLRAETVTPLWNTVIGRIALEYDLPENDRPGHSQQRETISFTLPLRIAGDGQLNLTGRWQYTHDSDAYSPLFGNERRTSRLWEARLAGRWPLNPRLDLLLDAGYSSQRSNIKLFDIDEGSVILGLGARF